MVRVHTHSLYLWEGKFLFCFVKLLSIVPMVIHGSSLSIDDCSSPDHISIYSKRTSAVNYTSTTADCATLLDGSSDLRHSFTLSRIEYESALVGSHLADERVELVRAVSLDDLFLHLLSGCRLM